MLSNEFAFRRKLSALLIVFVVSSGSPMSAQTHREPTAKLETVLSPGMTAWITDAEGREAKTRIVDVSGGVLTGAVGENIRRLPTTGIVRVRVRRSDSVLNGALIGAGVAVASGLLLCRATEPWENCRDDVGPMLRIGALGAGIGAGVDALIRGRRTVYEAASPQLLAVPIVAPHAMGLQFSLVF